MHEVSIKTFSENGKEKLFLNDPSFCKCQKEYYAYNPNLIRFCRYIFSLITHLFVIIVNEEIFFQVYIEMELKIFFIIFEEWFEWQK